MNNTKNQTQKLKTESNSLNFREFVQVQDILKNAPKKLKPMDSVYFLNKLISLKKNMRIKD
jgi:hypothetical protein